MYKVIKLFTDLQDNNYKYQAGDIFPRDGLVVSQERLDELSSDKNRRHTPLIEKIEEMPQAAESDTELEVDPEIEEREPETNGKAKAEKKPRKSGKKRGANAGASS